MSSEYGPGNWGGAAKEEALDALYPKAVEEEFRAMPSMCEKLGTMHNQMTEEAYQLWYKKSQDYGSKGDPFANFHTFGSYGILVRMYDKLSRLKSFEEKGFHAVADESSMDTCLDLINYAILYYAYLKLVKEGQ